MDYIQSVKNHYETVWEIKSEDCIFNKGPIHELPKGFKVVVFPPHGDRQLYTYATCGMSQSDDEYPVELHMFSSIQSEEIVELLVITAHFHRNAEQLGIGHTVNFGKSWLGSSESTYGLVSRPYLDGPKLEVAEIDGQKVSFYWLIPITPSELNTKKTLGVEALEEKFEASGFEYANPERSSLV